MIEIDSILLEEGGSDGDYCKHIRIKNPSIGINGELFMMFC